MREELPYAISGFIYAALLVGGWLVLPILLAQYIGGLGFVLGLVCNAVIAGVLLWDVESDGLG